jgi:hypothetical protein
LIVAAAVCTLLAACAGPQSQLATNTFGTTADMFMEGAFQVPNSGLILFIDVPGLRKTGEKGDINSGYAFEGSSGRFTVTFFVEPPHGVGTTHDAVHDYYWPLASRNPLIDKSSVKESSSDRYSKVEYLYRGEFRGKPVNIRHVNYYALVKDRWIDVHLSVSNPTQQDNAVLAALDKKLEFKVLGDK